MPFLTELSCKTNPLFIAALNLLFPPRCLSCSGDVTAAHSLCSDCFGKLNFISDPLCPRCGAPFEYALGEEALCAVCLHHPPPYHALRAALAYDDTSRALVTRLKYRDQHQLVPLLASQMWRAGAKLLAQANWLIPVPLHPKRLRTRKFNQSALLAQRISALSGVPVMQDALLRVQNTPPQAGLSREERLKNVQHAFRVHHARAGALRGSRVVLIDDVITTGATLDACTKILLGASVQTVYVLTLAKTLKEPYA